MLGVVVLRLSTRFSGPIRCLRRARVSRYVVDPTGIEVSLQNARAALHVRETPPPSKPAAATAVPDSEPDEGAVNPWLADQISKSAASREHRA